MRGPRPRSRERQLRKASPEAEQRLWYLLRDRRLGGFKFRRQHRIGRYYVDFVCLEQRLVIEADGGQHVERAGYDAARTHYLEWKGFRVLRFWNHEVLREQDQVLDVVLRELRSESG